MRRQLLAQQGHQRRVLKPVVVGNPQHHQRLVPQLVSEFLAQAVGVAALHHENGFGPAQVAGGHAHPGPRLGAGRARLVVRVRVEQPLGGEAAPLVLAANEEEALRFNLIRPGSFQNLKLLESHLIQERMTEIHSAYQFQDKSVGKPHTDTYFC